MAHPGRGRRGVSGRPPDSNRAPQGVPSRPPSQHRHRYWQLRVLGCTGQLPRSIETNERQGCLVPEASGSRSCQEALRQRSVAQVKVSGVSESWATQRCSDSLANRFSHGKVTPPSPFPTETCRSRESYELCVLQRPSKHVTSPASRPASFSRSGCSPHSMRSDELEGLEQTATETKQRRRNHHETKEENARAVCGRYGTMSKARARRTGRTCNGRLSSRPEKSLRKACAERLCQTALPTQRGPLWRPWKRERWRRIR